MSGPLPPFVRAVAGGYQMDLKVVPGARRERIAGLLGDRLKIAVRAPPEGGKANRAVIALVAAWTGVPPAAITLVAGPNQPRKTLLIAADVRWGSLELEGGR